MPRGPLISDRERTILAVIYNQYKEEKAEFIRQEASKRIGRELGLSTVQRELSKLRKIRSRTSTDPIDNAWSLGSLRKYPVTAPAIPLLLHIQNTFDANMPEIINDSRKEQGQSRLFLTIRLAAWISRLVILINYDPRIREDKQPLFLDTDQGKWSAWVDDLVSVAMFYSNYEISCELAHIEPVMTSMFDAPTLGFMKYKISLYLMGPIFGKEIAELSEEEQIKKFNSIDIRDLARKGGNFNARSYNKKR